MHQSRTQALIRRRLIPLAGIRPPGFHSAQSRRDGAAIPLHHLSASADSRIYRNLSGGRIARQRVGFVRCTKITTISRLGDGCETPLKINVERSEQNQPRTDAQRFQPSGDTIPLSDFLNILEQYRRASAAAPPATVEQDYSQVAQTAPAVGLLL